MRKGLLQRFEGGNDVVQDEIWTEAACEIIRDRMPRFLALHRRPTDYHAASRRFTSKRLRAGD
jgi:hypothetical protein